MRPRLLDLFCGAGGCAVGYSRAGFEVVGVDHRPMPRYPFLFVQADAMYILDAMVHEKRLPWTMTRHGIEFGTFAAIHASPPCQAYSSMRVMQNAGADHPELLEPTRELLQKSGLPWVLENVEQAPIDLGDAPLYGPENGVRLCGSMFGLATDVFELRRHRLFESNVRLSQQSCKHSEKEVIGFYGDHARRRTRINGHHARGTDIHRHDEKMSLVRSLMGIDWMTWEEATQAIPPAYTEFVGKQLIRVLSGSPP